MTRANPFGLVEADNDIKRILHCRLKECLDSSTAQNIDMEIKDREFSLIVKPRPL